MLYTIETGDMEYEVESDDRLDAVKTAFRKMLDDGNLIKVGILVSVKRSEYDERDEVFYLSKMVLEEMEIWHELVAIAKEEEDTY